MNEINTQLLSYYITIFQNTQKTIFIDHKLYNNDFLQTKYYQK